jgi:sterol desaturase/sphingolipid hydroxylase (fatty acid hydroxylase superfamily)
LRNKKWQSHFSLVISSFQKNRMDKLIEYFNHIPSSHRSIILVSGLVLFWVLEGVIPVKKLIYQKWKHAGLNLLFTLTTIVVNFTFAVLILKTSDWTVAHHFGLLQFVQMPLWVQFIGGMMLLDLIGAYFIHWTEHKVKWMWKFHIIHHTDTNVDTTTANRHHPGESIFRAVFTLAAVLVCGAPMWLVMVYQSLSALLSQFNHANIRLPKAVDKAISLVIVSPNMHKVHHHFAQPLTDTNYGNIFSIWDRLFGTFAYAEMETLNYGLDTHMHASEHDNLMNLMKIPFQPYRAPEGSKFS